MQSGGRSSWGSEGNNAPKEQRRERRAVIQGTRERVGMGRKQVKEENNKVRESWRCFLAECGDGRAVQAGGSWAAGSSVGHSVGIAYSSLILGCVLLAPQSSLNTLILKAGTERRPGLKARLMDQSSRSICCASSCQDGSFGVPKVSWDLHTA